MADRTLCLSAARPTSRAALLHVSLPHAALHPLRRGPWPCSASRPAGRAVRACVPVCHWRHPPRRASLVRPRHELERSGLGGEQQLELAALTGGALRQDVTAVRPGDGAHQRQPEAGAPGRAAVAAAEPVEDVPQQVGRDALAGVCDDQANRQPVSHRHYGQLDDVPAGGVPDRVLQQGVDGQAEPLPVGLHGDLVQPAELPAAIGGGPPPAQDLHGEAVQLDRLGLEELRSLGGRDDQQSFGDPPEPVQFTQYDLDVVRLLVAGQAVG